jgi:hypothetical protein
MHMLDLLSSRLPVVYELGLICRCWVIEPFFDYIQPVSGLHSSIP